MSFELISSATTEITNCADNDGLIAEKHTVFDIKNKRGEHIACIYCEAKYIKFDDEFRRYTSSFPGLISLIRSQLLPPNTK